MTAITRFESLRVTTPGATLAVRHYPGTGEPIVLLHGGPGMGDYFGALPELLSPPYRVVSYDQRGCGASSCDGSFDVHDQVADLDAIRKYFGANRIHIFGHSWGGLLGQLYANGHPQYVGSVVLRCSMANTGRKVAMVESKGVGERVIGRPKHSPVAWLAAGLLMQFPGRLGDLGFGYIMKQQLPNYVVRRDAAPKDFEVSRASKRAWRGTNTSVKALDDDYLAQLSVNAPILIVQGEHDVIRETNPLLVKRFPAALNVRIQNAAHFPWLEQPDVFAKTILDFYRNVTATDQT
jgi:proline iminopeptidase